jgi:hypothetical protein
MSSSIYKCVVQSLQKDFIQQVRNATKPILHKPDETDEVTKDKQIKPTIAQHKIPQTQLDHIQSSPEPTTIEDEDTTSLDEEPFKDVTLTQPNIVSKPETKPPIVPKSKHEPSIVAAKPKHEVHKQISESELDDTEDLAIPKKHDTYITDKIPIHEQKDGLSEPKIAPRDLSTPKSKKQITKKSETNLTPKDQFPQKQKVEPDTIMDLETDEFHMSEDSEETKQYTSTQKHPPPKHVQIKQIKTYTPKTEESSDQESDVPVTLTPQTEKQKKPEIQTKDEPLSGDDTPKTTQSITHRPPKENIKPKVRLLLGHFGH